MLTTDRVSGAALAVLAAVVLWESRRLPLGSMANPGPAYMPVVLALLLLAGGLAIAVRGDGPSLASRPWSGWRHTLGIFVTCAFAALALERLGYRLTILAALLFLLLVLERRRLLPALVFAAGFAIGTHALFDTLLRVPLPRGPLGF